MATEIGEQTQLKANLQFVLKVVSLVGVCVWGYSVLIARLNTLDMQLERVSHESTLLGDLSARVLHIEKFTEQAKADLDHLVEMQDQPITSDHQQFERIKYLEIELGRLRDKVEGVNR
jgi:hypothetical protein